MAIVSAMILIDDFAEVTNVHFPRPTQKDIEDVIKKACECSDGFVAEQNSIPILSYARCDQDHLGRKAWHADYERNACMRLSTQASDLTIDYLEGSNSARNDLWNVLCASNDTDGSAGTDAR
ncbi:hypothetical protein F4824DRAFT_498243 [Ustulina deusta]|nr:hypothetical protein F4824DRAFT_498243 [Ustulina deusta]